MLFKPSKPMDLNDFVRKRRICSLLVRVSVSASLLLAVYCVKLASPQLSDTVKTWVFGENRLDSAVSAFYESVSRGRPAADAISAFCRTLDDEAP